MLKIGSRLRLSLAAAGAAVGAAAIGRADSTHSLPTAIASEAEEDVVVENWSSTHSARPRAYFQPDSPQGVQRILSAMSEAGQRLRVVGSALSPNGIGLSDEGMLNMAMCGEILSIDAERQQVTVQAGARVQEVVDALRPHGLTLQNYASIAEQQIGGFLQVGAHGTGAAIPPVDEQVVRFTLHTPGLGALELSEESNPRLFWLAKVGLGQLGVVSEVTLQCVPAHKLVQHTFTETREGVARRHLEHLAHKHMRYMWIPHTDTVVVVTCDPLIDGQPPPPPPPPEAEKAAVAPLRELLLSKGITSNEKARDRVGCRNRGLEG
jgi:L-galactono-1,4-lactone dehydrogenase